MSSLKNELTDCKAKAVHELFELKEEINKLQQENRELKDKAETDIRGKNKVSVFGRCEWLSCPAQCPPFFLPLWLTSDLELFLT